MFSNSEGHTLLTNDADTMAEDTQRFVPKRRSISSFAAKFVRFVKRWKQESVWAGPVVKALLAVLGLGALAAIGAVHRARAASAPAVIESVAAIASAASLREPPPAGLVGQQHAAAVVAPVVTAKSPLEAPAAAVTGPSPHDVAAGSARGGASVEDPVYLNSATLPELRRLPGIGEKRGQAILALRERMGHFQRVEELMKVKGIGKAMIKRLRPLVRLDPRAPPSSPAPPSSTS